jgi:hypothetical protein
MFKKNCEGLLAKTTGGYLMLNTVRGAVDIIY